MSTRRRPAHHEEEEHENHERWLVTYADMVTLLMVLFIVMFSISQVDQRKFAELRDGLSSGFGSQDSILQGAQSLNPDLGSQAVSPQLLQTTDDPATQALVQQALQETDRLERERKEADAKRELARLERLREQLEASLAEAGLEDDVRASYDDRGLVLSLVSRHVVFEDDLAVLTERGARVVDALSGVLRGVADPVEVDGHTNQVPVRPKFYDTDWDLSAARALTVLRRLQAVGELPPRRLSLAAFGHTRPLVDPAEPRSQQVNKRVDLVVLASTDPETSALIPDLAGGRGSRSGSTASGSETPSAPTTGGTGSAAPALVPNPTSTPDQRGPTS